MKQFTLLFALIIAFYTSNAKTIKILFVGNSYIYVNDLPKTVYDLALSKGDSISYTTQAIGGASAMSLWNTSTVTASIAQGGWDYVVIQCQSQEPAFSPSQVATDTYPYVKKLDSLVQVTNTCAETMFFMTWGRKNGDAANAPFYPLIGTYEGMQSRLRESYLMFAQDFTASVSPVGVAWKNVRTQYPSIELYNPDESHPSIYGTYLAACVFYSSIFHKPATGASFITTGISTTDATNLQTIASNTILDSIDNWQQFGTIPFAKFSTNSSTNKTIVFINQSKHAVTYDWEFGDGQNSNLLNPIHTYTADGNYTVCLTITNACGKQEKYCNAVSVITTPNNIPNLEQEKISFIQDSNTITFKNITKSTEYQLINSNGVIVQKGIIKNNATLSFNEFLGVYFIQLKNTSKPFKIVLP